MKIFHYTIANTLFHFLLIVLSCFSFSTNLYAQTEDAIAKHRQGKLVIKVKSGDEVTVEQLRHEFWFGAAIGNGLANGSMSADDLRQYKEKFLENFNAAVTENAVKWPNMEPQKGQVNYQVVDGILRWTEENNIPLRAHNLFWGISKFVQPWVKELDDQELRQTLQHRAETITRRYQGRFAEYDLNNEMIHGNYYEERLGPDITKLMTQWAHNGDPDARLFLNDYDILTGNKLPEYMAQIRDLLKQGVPIAGIGVQGHLHDVTFDRQQLKSALDSLATFDLPIRITEFNMPGQRSKFLDDRDLEMTAEEAEANAKEMVDYYTICFAHPAVDGILMWGFWEGANWIPASSMYKRDWTPTPLAKAYQNLIFKEWWTKKSGTADNNGVFTTAAFYGTYQVSVNGNSKEVDLTKEQGEITVDFTK
uniref:Endo-1,4-beta-xylanase n=1 Tax=Roseihalotalea indica TaxID=2867963 RepID=A0AA49JJM4_9BACT|nr:endo-1,4-beta-xylanase [Tunicatimonas sp. TK19036]